MSDYTLPDLAYDPGALEPHLSGQIVELHHDKHHAAYVRAPTPLSRSSPRPAHGQFRRDSSDAGEDRSPSTSAATCCTRCSGPTCPPTAATSPSASSPRRSTSTSARSTPSRRSSARRPRSCRAPAGASCRGSRSASGSIIEQLDDHQGNVTLGAVPLLVDRRVGARLLPAVQERQGRLRRGDLEHRQLGRRRRRFGGTLQRAVSIRPSAHTLQASSLTSLTAQSRLATGSLSLHGKLIHRSVRLHT